MGRKPIPPKLRKPRTLIARCTDDLYRQLTKACEQSGLLMGEEIRQRLAMTFAARVTLEVVPSKVLIHRRKQPRRKRSVRKRL